MRVIIATFLILFTCPLWASIDSELSSVRAQMESITVSYNQVMEALVAKEKSLLDELEPLPNKAELTIEVDE